MLEQIPEIYTFKNNFSLEDFNSKTASSISRTEQIDSYKIIWIKDGKGKYTIDFKSYSFENSVLFFLSPNQFFSIQSEAIKEAYILSFSQDFYCIQVHDSEVSCNGLLFNNAYKTPFLTPTENDTVKLDFIITNIKEEFNHNETATYDMLQAYLKQFIIMAVRIKKESTFFVKEIETKLFKEFNILVEAHFKETHSVGYYANKLGVSPKSLTKHFQKITNASPSTIIKNRILTEAKRQLLYSKETIKQIGFDLGFNDPAYFSRFFTKAVGKSPKQFQKEYQL